MINDRWTQIGRDRSIDQMIGRHIIEDKRQIIHRVIHINMIDYISIYDICIDINIVDYITIYDR